MGSSRPIRASGTTRSPRLTASPRPRGSAKPAGLSRRTHAVHPTVAVHGVAAGGGVAVALALLAREERNGRNPYGRRRPQCRRRRAGRSPDPHALGHAASEVRRPHSARSRRLRRRRPHRDPVGQGSCSRARTCLGRLGVWRKLALHGTGCTQVGSEGHSGSEPLGPTELSSAHDAETRLWTCPTAWAGSVTGEAVVECRDTSLEMALAAAMAAATLASQHRFLSAARTHEKTPLLAVLSVTCLRIWSQGAGGAAGRCKRRRTWCARQQTLIPG